MEGATTNPLAPIDLATLPSHLDRMATPTSIGDADERDLSQRRFLDDLAQLARRLMRADCVAIARFTGNLEPRDFDVTPSTESYPSSELERVKILMALAAESGQTEIDHFESIQLIATVSVEPGGDTIVMGSALNVGQSALEPFLVTQQLITSAIATRRARVAERVARRQQQLQRWIAELRSSIDCSDSFAQVADHVVDAIAINLEAHQVAFCRKRGENLSRIEVIAIGGSGTPISHLHWHAVASEGLLRNGATRWPAESDDDVAATIAHREIAQSISSRHQSVSVPLRKGDGVPFAILILVGSEGIAPTKELLTLGDAVSRGIAAWDANHRSVVGRATRGGLRLIRSRLGFIAAIIVVALISMLPIKYRVSADATVVPRVRSFIVAPHSGLLRSANVRVGDIVERGTPIAELDDRELRMDMSSLLAQRDRAAKKRDIERAGGRIAEEQLAEFELARVNEQIKLTEHRLSNLKIVSPINGVVLEGEMEDVDGAPVETGQLLAEIAKLDELWIEVHVPEEELAEVRAGQNLRVALSAADDRIIEAAIESISPGAQIKNGENVFVARAPLSNPDSMLRPGISGTAKIDGNKRPLVAVILRHVWRRISRFWI